MAEPAPRPDAGRAFDLAAKKPAFLLELGLTCAAMGMAPMAIEALRAALRAQPDLQTGWAALADLLREAGDNTAAETAASEAARRPAAQAARGVPLARLLEAERKLQSKVRHASPQPPAAILRAHILANPDDAAALRGLAAALAQAGDGPRAIALLRRALALAPAYMPARRDLLALLLAGRHWADALMQIEALLAATPQDVPLCLQRAATLGNLSMAPQAIAAYETIRGNGQLVPMAHRLRYATLLRTGGDTARSEAEFRACIADAPGTGAAYFGLADLKSDVLTDADIAAMREMLAHGTISDDDRSHFHYAMGYALERRQDFAASFAHIEQAAALRRKLAIAEGSAYDPDDFAARVSRNRGFFTAARLRARTGQGYAEAGPIFILGMPRSGSTLLEQILASHSLVEGLQELPEIDRLINQLRSHPDPALRYPPGLDRLAPAQIAALGQSYIERCAAYRTTTRPYFIDKMPGNWVNIGFIHMILPNARIIDARRHPLAAGFGAFKQLIVGGGNFTYSLSHIGRRYRDYIDLMAYFDDILPGRVHRVIYEDLVEDADAQIRALLAYCGLPFEPQCLRFWETERVVRTPSASQVRRPLSREGLAQWQRFEPFLGELKTALGPALEHWRGWPGSGTDLTSPG